MTEEINYKELTEKLEEDIKLKDKLINKLTTDKILKEYLNGDEVIKSIVELIKSTQFILHKSTLKKFMTNENLLQYELIETTKQSQKLNKEQYLITTTKTLNKKLEELKSLKLIETSKQDYAITATDKLLKLILEDTKRVKKSTKDESELKIITEDKLIAARLNVIKNKDEITQKMERYKYIYKVETCSYVIGRKLDETTELIKKRIDYLVKQINFDIANNKSNRNYIIRIQNKPLYLELGGEFYKVIYREGFRTFEEYLNVMCDSTRSSYTEEELYNKMSECYTDLVQEILNKNIDVEKVLSQDELEHIENNNNNPIKLEYKVVIYIHETTDTTIIDYLNNKLKSMFYDYEIRKYTT